MGKMVLFRVLGSRHPSIGDSSHKQSHHAIDYIQCLPFIGQIYSKTGQSRNPAIKPN